MSARRLSHAKRDKLATTKRLFEKRKSEMERRLHLNRREFFIREDDIFPVIIEATVHTPTENLGVRILQLDASEYCGSTHFGMLLPPTFAGCVRVTNTDRFTVSFLFSGNTPRAISTFSPYRFKPSLDFIFLADYRTNSRRIPANARDQPSCHVTRARRWIAILAAPPCLPTARQTKNISIVFIVFHA